MKRKEYIEQLESGIIDIEVDGVKFNASVSAYWLPHLPENTEHLRTNIKDTDQVSFFDMNTNAWVSYTNDELGIEL